MDLLTQDMFLAYITEQARIDVSGELNVADLELSQLDSFHLMEVICAVDELGVILEEDALTSVETLGQLYTLYAAETAGAFVDQRETM